MVTHSFPRAEGDVSGASIWRLADGLVTRGHRVLVIAPADGGEVGAPLLGSVEVQRVRYASPARETLAYAGTMHRRAWRSPVAVLAFAQLVRALSRAVSAACRAGDANILHAHGWIPGGLSAALADRHGRPLVVTLHGDDVAMARSIRGGRVAMGAVLRRAASVTVVSSYLAESAAQTTGLAREAIALTPMPLVGGIPGETAPERLGAVFAGMLVKDQGVSVLLEALAMLKKAGRTIELTVVGDGSERSALKAQALALSLAVTFVGFVPPEQVAVHLRGKRLFVLPALEEDPGLMITEALTQGVPVVATRLGGAPDLLAEPGAGLLVPPGDAPALAEAMKTVLEGDQYLVDAERAGRALSRRLSAETVAEGFEKIYAKARGSRRSAVAHQPDSVAG